MAPCATQHYTTSAVNCIERGIFRGGCLLSMLISVFLSLTLCLSLAQWLGGRAPESLRSFYLGHREGKKKPLTPACPCRALRLADFPGVTFSPMSEPPPTHNSLSDQLAQHKGEHKKAWDDHCLHRYQSSEQQPGSICCHSVHNSPLWHSCKMTIMTERHE